MRLIDSIDRAPPWLRSRVKRWAAEYLVPANRMLGIRVVHVASDSSSVVLRLPSSRRNLNLDGTVHGGVILALAETAHGIAVLWQFSPRDYSMVTKTARLSFLAPGRNELTVRFGLDSTTRMRIAKELEDYRRAEVELTDIVYDAGGHAIAELRASYVIKPRAARVHVRGR